MLAFVLWLPLLCGSHKLQAKDLKPISAVLKSERIIDNCDTNSKNVLVTISIGNITKADSLYGCSFQLSFDSNKIKFTDLIKLNTLFEYFSNTSVGFYYKGSATGYGANLGFSDADIVYGDRPLFALYGKWIGDCNDSCKVKLDYLDFTDEFGKKITDTVNASVVALPYSITDLTISGEANKAKSVYNVKNIDTVSVDFNVESNKFVSQNQEFAININGSGTADYSIDNIVLSNDNIIFKNYEKINNNVFRLYFRSDAGSINTDIHLNLRLNKSDNIHDTLNIYPVIDIDNSCGCYSIANNDTIIVYKSNEPNAVVDNKYIENIKYFNNLLFIDNIESNKRIKIYNVLGIELDDIGLQNNSLFYDFNSKENGVYFVEIYDLTSNKLIKIIKN